MLAANENQAFVGQVEVPSVSIGELLNTCARISSCVYADAIIYGNGHAIISTNPIRL